MGHDIQALAWAAPVQLRHLVNGWHQGSRRAFLALGLLVRLDGICQHGHLPIV